MKDVISATASKENDKLAIENGESAIWLMLKAGKALYSSYDFTGKRVLIVCGGGNNGGDGLVLALLLKEKGVYSEVLLCKDSFSKDAIYYFDKVKKAGIKYSDFSADFDFSSFDVIVDALLGTGFFGKLKSDLKNVINVINAQKAFKISVDIPSGLNGNNGIGKTCVKADLTIAINNLKTGHFLNDAKDFVGKIRVADIGILNQSVQAKLVEKQDFSLVFPKRKSNSHKGVYGYTALIGGSDRYSGAIKLASCSLATLRAGAGVVKLAVPDCISDAVMPYCVESTLFPLRSSGGKIRFDKKEFDELLKNVRTVGFGCGVGDGRENEKIVSYLLENFTGKLVLDADGLNALSRIGVDKLNNAVGEVILTPHVREFTRLVSMPVEEVLKDPIEVVRNFAKKYNVIVLLKGATSIISDGKEVLLCDRGCSGMAKGGSGDCLTGVTVGICAHSTQSDLINVACACFVCGVAGELAEKKYNPYSMTPRDEISFIGPVVSDILELQK